MSILVQTGCCASRPSTPGATVLRSAFRAVRTILGWPLRVHANRRLLNQMAGMSAYELADIGLTPADLRDTGAMPLDTEVGHFLSARVAARRYARGDRRV